MARHRTAGKSRHANQAEVLALVMLGIFSAYVLLLSNTSASALAIAKGSVVFAEDSPVRSAGLAAAGSNAYSIPLMFVLSLAFLVPAEMLLRKQKR